MPRRVLFMISSMSGGGSERQTLLLLQHLDRTRFVPHLYLTNRTGDFLSQVPNDVMVHSFDDAGPSAGLYFPGKELRRQSRYVHSILQRESIEVIYDRTFHMSMVADAPARQLEIPRVSTMVSPPHFALPLVESRFVWLKKLRLAKAYRASKQVVAVSQQTADSAVSYYGLPPESVEVIINPVDIAAVRESAVQTVVERDDCITIACIGRMSREKGHADLIQALALSESETTTMPKICVWMIGDGPLRTSIETLAKSKLSHHEVQFLGRQDNPMPWIKAADAVVLPSHFEGLPNVVLEAMAIGTPIIATRAGGTIELERDEPTILWARSNDPKSLSQAMTDFINNRQSAKMRSENATRLVETHHNIRKTIKQIEALLSL